MHADARNTQRVYPGAGKGARPCTLRRLIGALMLLVALSACEDHFPRDPDKTLETILSTGQMTVAAVDHVPWVVIAGEGSPQGAEVDLVEAFADDLGAEITWKRLPASEAMEGLEHGDVNLAIGGFGRKAVTPTPGAAPTYAYYREALVIGARPGTSLAEGLDGRAVFVPPDQPVSQLVRNNNGVPVNTWSEEVTFAVLPYWQLESRDLEATGIVLQRTDHVMMIPQGENAWLMRLERFLRSETGNMGELLREHYP